MRRNQKRHTRHPAPIARCPGKRVSRLAASAQLDELSPPRSPMLCSVVQVVLTDPRSSGRPRRTRATTVTTAIVTAPPAIQRNRDGGITYQLRIQRGHRIDENRRTSISVNPPQRARAAERRPEASGGILYTRGRSDYTPRPSSIANRRPWRGVFTWHDRCPALGIRTGRPGHGTLNAVAFRCQRALSARGRADIDVICSHFMSR